MKNPTKKTIQNTESETKQILKSVDREFFQLYCEENDVLKESMDDLLAIARSEDNIKVRTEIRKFLVEHLIGKPHQSAEIKGDMKVSAGIFINDLD